MLRHFAMRSQRERFHQQTTRAGSDPNPCLIASCAHCLLQSRSDYQFHTDESNRERPTAEEEKQKAQPEQIIRVHRTLPKRNYQAAGLPLYSLDRSGVAIRITTNWPVADDEAVAGGTEKRIPVRNGFQGTAYLWVLVAGNGGRFGVFSVEYHPPGRNGI